MICPTWADVDPRDYNGSIFGKDYNIPAGQAIDKCGQSFIAFGVTFSQVRNKFPFSLVDTLTESLQVLLGQRSAVDPNINVQLPGTSEKLSMDFTGLMSYLSVIRVMLGVIFTYYITRYFAGKAWGLR